MLVKAANSAMAAVQKSAVLYHYPCPDGAFAALAAYIYFSHSPAAAPPMFFPNTVYSPLRAENLPLNEIDNVYLVDFVGPPGFIEQLSSKVGRVVVLDHHKTALEMLGSGSSTNGNVTKVIDMDRSGATIAYDYFKEKLLTGDTSSGIDGAVADFGRVWKLFEYIEDADLWRWRLPNSKAFSSGLKDLNLEFDFTLNPSLFQQLLSLELNSVISQGMSSLADKQRRIEEVLELSYETALGGGTFGNCLAVNADSIQELRSELGHQLACKSIKANLRGIGAVVYRVPELENDSLLKVSLRSVHEEDTTPISQKYGGGGHRNASSFMIDNSEFQRVKFYLPTIPEEFGIPPTSLMLRQEHMQRWTIVEDDAKGKSGDIVSCSLETPCMYCSINGMLLDCPSSSTSEHSPFFLNTRHNA